MSSSSRRRPSSWRSLLPSSPRLPLLLLLLAALAATALCSDKQENIPRILTRPRRSPFVPFHVRSVDLPAPLAELDGQTDTPDDLPGSPGVLPAPRLALAAQRRSLRARSRPLRARTRLLPRLQRRAARGLRLLRRRLLPQLANSTARLAGDMAAGAQHVLEMVETEVVPRVSAGAEMIRRKAEPAISSALGAVSRKVLGERNHRLVTGTLNRALGQFNEMRSAFTNLTSEISSVLSPADDYDDADATDDADYDNIDADASVTTDVTSVTRRVTDVTPSVTPDRSDSSRGLFSHLLSGALALAGLNVTDPLSVLARPFANRFVSDRRPVSLDDGRIVFGLGSGSGSGSDSDSGSDTKKNDDQAASESGSKPCTTPQGGAGLCRDLGACPQLLLNLNNLRSSICFQDIFIPGVCCPSSSSSSAETTEKPATTSTTNKKPATTERATKRPQPATQRPKPTTVRPVPPIPNKDLACGVPQAPEYRIVGGSVSRPGQWPWMAAIYLHGNNRKELWCGGSLISKRYIITAAHCTKDSNGKSFHPRQFTVHLGDFDLSTDEDVTATEIYTVSSYRIHPDFKINGFYNDIALFKLSRPVELNEYVIPACLPVEYEGTPLDSLVGRTPSVIGWGTTFYGGQESAVLRHAELPVWTQKDCDNAYFQPIRDIFICAGYADGGKDACQGDSGGPLVLFENGRWMQIGIVSFGNRCAKPGFPGVYTRITEFLPWIRENMV